MLLKLFFVFAVALFGALMFLAGVLAPEHVRAPTAVLAARVVAALPLLGEEKAAAKAPAEAAKDEGKKTPPIPLENLLLPTPLPAKASYALQVGQFGSAEAADLLLKKASSGDLPAVSIAVVDRSGQPWWVVAVGQFGQPDEARTARGKIASQLGASEETPIIVLPPAAP